MAWFENTDEGRGKLRNASARCKQPLNRRSLNETSLYIPKGRGTRGSETSQYPEEKKSIEMPLLSERENGRRQTE
jgi:hypothetical protein